MAHDAWIEYGGVELINLSRTAQLAMTLGIDTVWAEPSSVQWIEDALGGSDYDVISSAPWYDAGFPASAEFAGIVPLSISGLDDSTLEATTTEYITNGGSSGKARNKTLTVPVSLAIVASTDRGADFGKRWLDRVLKGGGARTFCSGATLRYFQYEPTPDALTPPPVVHRRDVSLSRGTSVTRKRPAPCSSTWWVTFTLVANDPFEYGDDIEVFAGLGGVDILGTFLDFGSLPMIEQACPVYDYSPIYDPTRPALVAPPTAPDFYPDGWDLVVGANFERHWVRIATPEPSTLHTVPVLTLETETDARMVRVQVWPSTAEVDTLCDPLWTAIVSYLPAGVQMVIDGEQEAVYVWDGYSPVVRRADSLVYGTGATPLDWTTITDPESLLVTLDVMDGAAYDGGGTVRAALSLVPKSD